MSLFGLWSSSMVLILFYTFHTALPFCVLPTSNTITSGVTINCYKVLNSAPDSIFGVPLDVFAAIYFIINLFLVYLIAFGKERIYKPVMKTLFGWRFFGLALVPYLVYLELFVVKSICVYCTVMHTAIIIDFIIISYLLFYKK